MSSQSSSDLIAPIQSAQTYLCRFAGPLLIIMGTVGCILNLIVFTQRTLRKNPYSLYFIAYNIVNILYIYCSLLLFLTVNLGYNINLNAYNLVLCRFYFYTTFLFHCLSQFYLILASIDRILITSPNALTRRRSTHRLAYVCVIIGTLFWALFHCHALILPNIIEIAPHYFVCSLQPGIETSFVTYYTIIKETLVLSLMMMCGLWSIKNIRDVRRVRAVLNEPVRRTAVESRVHSTSSKDRQLTFILIADITMYALFTFVLAIFFIYEQITQNDVKSPDRIELENIARNICLFSITIPCCISCYANLIVSKTFRNEVKKVLLCK